MKSTQRKRWAALLLSGSVLPVLGTCSPEDYFALSARAVSVAVADSILATAISPIFDALGLPEFPNDMLRPVSLSLHESLLARQWRLRLS